MAVKKATTTVARVQQNLRTPPPPPMRSNPPIAAQPVRRTAPPPVVARPAPAPVMRAPAPVVTPRPQPRPQPAPAPIQRAPIQIAPPAMTPEQQRANQMRRYQEEQAKHLQQRLDRLTPEQRAQIGQPGQMPPMSIVAPGGGDGSTGTIYTPGQPPQRIPGRDELLRSGQPGLPPPIPLPHIYIEDPVQRDAYFGRLGEEYMRNIGQPGQTPYTQPGGVDPSLAEIHGGPYRGPTQPFPDTYNGMDPYGGMTPGQALGGGLTMTGPQVQPPQMTAQAALDPLASQMSQYLGIAQNFNK